MPPSGAPEEGAYLEVLGRTRGGTEAPPPDRDHRDGTATSGSGKGVKQGGWMIPYEDEDPEIRVRYEKALKENGVVSQMPKV